MKIINNCKKENASEVNTERKKKILKIIRIIVVYFVVIGSFFFLIKIFLDLNTSRIVNVNDTVLKEQPDNTSYTKIYLKIYEEIKIIEEYRDWYLINTNDNIEGYVEKQYISKDSFVSQMQRVFNKPLKPILLLLLMVLFYPTVIFISSFAWKFILEEICGKKVPIKIIVEVYGKSNIAKYIPSNVMHFVGRNYLGKKMGFSQTELGISNLLDVIFFLLSIVMLILILIISGVIKIQFQTIYSRINPTNLLITLSIIIIVIIIAIIIVSILIKKNIIKRDILNQLSEIRKRFSLKRLLLLFLKTFSIYSIILIIEALLLVFTFVFIFGVDLTIKDVGLIIGSYISACFFSLFIPAAPNSILIRESLIALMLMGNPFGNVVLISLVFRIISIFGDIVMFIYSSILSIKNKQKIKQKYLEEKTL